MPCPTMANMRDGLAMALGIAAMTWKAMRRSARLPRLDNSRPPVAGISVIIPSRHGRQLLEQMLAGVEADLAASGQEGEIVVVDNGSSDDTGGYLRRAHPAVRVEAHGDPLSFAGAANRGAALARYARLCLLNNDMEIEPGFFRALAEAFSEDPALFCASAQIFFPPAARREETGKTALRRAEDLTPDDYPVFCDLPLEGENFSPVLYGSGGCSLYDREKFLALGGFDEFYQPAYVEDLDLGYRAWLCGWPSIYAASARVLHHHRATSGRFYKQEELNRLLEVNHVRFLLRGMQSAEVFSGYYQQAIARLRRVAPAELALVTEPRQVFRAAARPRLPGRDREKGILDLTGGAVRFFPGRAPARGRRMLVSAGSHASSPRCIEQVPNSTEIYLAAFCRPGAAPDERLLELCRVVIYVEGKAGDGPYRAALQHAQRRYSISDTVCVEPAWE